MKLSHDFLIKILQSVPAVNDGHGRMHLIVKHPYVHLLTELHEVFGEQGDVEIKLDKRQGERRTLGQPCAPERRQQDRRKDKETLLEVILAA